MTFSTVRCIHLAGLALCLGLSGCLAEDDTSEVQSGPQAVAEGQVSSRPTFLYPGLDPAFARSGPALPTEELSDCDPLVPEYCMFPFPNNFWLREDATTDSGYRLHFGETTFPKDRLQRHIDPTDWHTLDGFSPIPAIMAYFDGVVLDNVPHHWDIARSLDSDSPTVLIDAETGERIPHFAELNENLEAGQPKAFMIWPAYRLKDAHRYIVGIRYLENNLGELIPPSPAFKDLRDGTTSNNPDVEARRTYFEDIFARLMAVGVPRMSLQLAWDFNTASRENLTDPLVYARDDAMARVPASGPKYTISSIEDEYSETIYRKIVGRMTVPYYTDKVAPGGVLVLDANGNPVFQGWTTTRFTVLIPRSLVTNHKAGRILQYGHGLLGGQGEVEAGYLKELADRYGYVLAATDWWGMCAQDVVTISWMLINDIGNFKMLPDRSTQGMVNALLLMRMMSTSFAKDPAVTFDGVSVIDPTQRSYYGNSQGGILGGVYMAATQDVQYGTLGVPGAPYGILLPRSVDFSPFYIGLKRQYPHSHDQIMLISIMQMLWDRAEPSGFIGSITSNPLPNTPTHKVIFQYAYGDAQVTWLGAEIMGRSVGAGTYEETALIAGESLYGFPTVGASSTQSLIMPYDFGVTGIPVTNLPPNDETDTHEKPRRERTAQDQMDLFFRTGVIQQMCDGACDPT